jgi:hypothetical protein
MIILLKQLQAQPQTQAGLNQQKSGAHLVKRVKTCVGMTKKVLGPRIFKRRPDERAPGIWSPTLEWASKSRTQEGRMIRKLKSGEYRLYSRKKNPKTGKRRNLGTFSTRKAAEKHEQAVQFFKRK